MKDIFIKLNSVDYRGSVCDGPGIRTLVFFQGCERKCKNCHNLSTWPKDGGRKVSVEELVNEIIANSKTKRITITGGEPLLQIKGLSELCKRLASANYDIALYTGNDLKDVPKNILELINYIKCGEYIDELRTTIEFYGSKNQEFIVLKQPKF